MGSNSTAALTGDMTKESSGTDNMPTDDKPPLDKPTSKAAKLAKKK